MPSCVVKSCKNYLNKNKKRNGITYHEFPRNKISENEWTQIIRICRGDPNWKPSSASTVCSAHFDDDDFKTTDKGLRCLFPYAIPKKLLSRSPNIEIEQKSLTLISQHQLPGDTITFEHPPTFIKYSPSSSSPTPEWQSMPATTRLQYQLMKKDKCIQNLRRKIKTLNQSVRRLQSRNKSLKCILQCLKKHIVKES